MRHLPPKELFLHALIIALPFVALGALTWHRLAPSGVFTVSAATTERSPYVNRILPQDRAPLDASGDYLTLIDEPGYFSVNVPDGYTSVDVTVEYRNHGQPIIELGALTDIFSQSYDLRPLENTVVDALDWQEDTVEGVRVLQREDAVNVNTFLTNPPPLWQIATYHADLPTAYRDAAYVPLGHTQTLDASLRGYHKFATYIKDEAFSFTFGFTDMNRTEGSDAGVVRVWNDQGQPVLEKFFDDDGNTAESQGHEGVQYLTLTGEGWSEGVYTVELSGTSDIFWRTITTPQRFVTFVNRMYIGDDVGYRDGDRRTSFITNAKHFVFETYHADSAEEVTLGGVALQLPESHEKVRYDVAEQGLVAGYTDKGDLFMTGDGLFALTDGSFFNPYPVRMNAYTDLDALNVDYVLTTYEPPTPLGDGWSSATATFDLAHVYQAEGSATFLLSAPGIAERDGKVDVRRITLAYHKQPPTLRDMARQLRDWFLH